MKSKVEVAAYNAFYYLKHKEEIIKRIRKHQVETNYASEKTEKQRTIRNIKRLTRYYFKLEGHNCEFCGNKATEHHHNSLPIEIDKFNFVCHNCHNIIEKEVKQKNARI
jgi:hypothetical protein